jgi:RHS repeat-associated protein
VSINLPKYRPHYYPFGSSLNTRSFSAGSGFRFGFNGKEKENDFIANEYTFEFRIYNSGLGRFLSTDPIGQKYPWQTTYAYYCNSPISILDFLGLGDQPNWYSDNSNKNKREIKKFRGILNKQDREKFDQISKMDETVEKTKAVDEFVAHLNEAYKDKGGLYRIYKSKQSTGQNVIFSMANIWAFKIDKHRRTEVFTVEKSEPKPLNWEKTSETEENDPIFINKTGADSKVQVQFSKQDGVRFSEQDLSLIHI